MWCGQFDFVDGGGNIVVIILEGEESVYLNFFGMSVVIGLIYYEMDIDIEFENFFGILIDFGILFIEGVFEEEINGDNVFCYLLVIYNL